MIILVFPLYKRISGGGVVATAFAADISDDGISPTVDCIWNRDSGSRLGGIRFPSRNPLGITFGVLTYIPLLLSLAWRIYIVSLNQKNCAVIVTHFSTLPLAFLLKLVRSRVRVINFYQDKEWKFFGGLILPGFIRAISFLSFYFSDIIVYANKYLESIPSDLGFASVENRRSLHSAPSRHIVYPIWCDKRFVDSAAHCFKSPLIREYDVAFCVRSGYAKNPSAYLDFSRISHKSPDPLRLVAFGPSNTPFLADVSRLDNAQTEYDCNFTTIAEILSNSRMFLVLSRHEGFGLTALEAMAFGCVPLVLDNGGCSNFLSGYPELILPQNSSPRTILERANVILGDVDNLACLSQRLMIEAASGLHSASRDRSIASAKIRELITNSNLSRK